MNDNSNPSVLKECIDFIQQREQDIIDEDSPFSEGDDDISYDIAKESKRGKPLLQRRQA